MSTATQTQTSPTRKLFPNLSPPRAVVNIIASKRHASSVDLKGKPNGNASVNGSASTSNNAPSQRRTVSTPLANDREDSESDAEKEEEQPVPDASTSTPSTVKVASIARHKLTFPHAAKIFVKLRRVQKKVKAHHIDSNSGAEPITNGSLLNESGEPEVSKKLARLEIQDVYVCADGVDVAKLLRASRATLLERASPLYANVLIDEQWTSSICGPKHRSDGSFRVHIRYAATAATSSSKRDPRQPVALDEISGVPGLMTIVLRDTVAVNVVELYRDEDAQVGERS